MAAIRSLTTAFDQAVLSGDWSGFVGMFTQDAVMMPPNDAVLPMSEFLAWIEPMGNSALEHRIEFVDIDVGTGFLGPLAFLTVPAVGSATGPVAPARRGSEPALIEGDDEGLPSLEGNDDSVQSLEGEQGQVPLKPTRTDHPRSQALPERHRVDWGALASHPCPYLNRITLFVLVADWAGPGSLLLLEPLKWPQTETEKNPRSVLGGWRSLPF